MPVRHAEAPSASSTYMAQLLMLALYLPVLFTYKEIKIQRAEQGHKKGPKMSFSESSTYLA